MLEIKSALVLKSKTGPDEVFLETNYPCPYVEEFMPSQKNLQITFNCTADTGEQYVLENFNIQPKVVRV